MLESLFPRHDEIGLNPSAIHQLQPQEQTPPKVENPKLPSKAQAKKKSARGETPTSPGLNSAHSKPSDSQRREPCGRGGAEIAASLLRVRKPVPQVHLLVQGKSLKSCEWVFLPMSVGLASHYKSPRQNGNASVSGWCGFSANKRTGTNLRAQQTQEHSKRKLAKYSTVCSTRKQPPKASEATLH